MIPSHYYFTTYFKLNEKFINSKDIYSWVRHKNNIINLNLSTLAHLSTLVIHTNIFLYLITNKIYYHEWWYWYFMICYFLYLITYNKLTNQGSFMNSEYKNGRSYYVCIYNTTYGFSIPRIICNIIMINYHNKLSKFLYGPHFYITPNSCLIILILANLFVWPWTLLLNLNNPFNFFYTIYKNFDRLHLVIGKSELEWISCYIRYTILNILCLWVIIALILLSFI